MALLAKNSSNRKSAIDSVFETHTEASYRAHIPQIVTLAVVKKRMGAKRGTKVTP